MDGRDGIKLGKVKSHWTDKQRKERDRQMLRKTMTDRKGDMIEQRKEKGKTEKEIERKTPEQDWNDLYHRRTAIVWFSGGCLLVVIWGLLFGSLYLTPCPLAQTGSVLSEGAATVDSLISELSSVAI